MAKQNYIIKKVYILLAMLPLVIDLEMANTLLKKVKVLQQYFYSSIKANFIDIIDTIFNNSSFKDPLLINCTVNT